MKPVTGGIALAVLAVLSWALFTVKGDLNWDITAIGWAVDLYVTAAIKVLHT